MPTGYTQAVQSGKVTEFRDFAMQCARAFGALVTMRDDPQDAPIPDEFKPSDYHQKALANAEAVLARLNGLSPEQVVVEAAAAGDEQQREWERREAQRQVEKGRYEAMLAKVDSWQAPTPDHEGLKKFMREQLTSSIDFDCGGHEPKPRLSPDEWLAQAIESAEWSVQHHAEELQDEKQRAQERTDWVQALRGSL